MMFARNVDIADKYLCQLFHRIFSVSPLRIVSATASPAPAPYQSVLLSSPSKPVPAKLTLQSKILKKQNHVRGKL